MIAGTEGFSAVRASYNSISFGTRKKSNHLLLLSKFSTFFIQFPTLSFQSSRILFVAEAYIITNMHHYMEAQIKLIVLTQTSCFLTGNKVEQSSVYLKGLCDNLG